MVAEINASPTTGASVNASRWQSAYRGIVEWLQYHRPPVDELMKPKKAVALGNQFQRQGLAIRVDDPNLGSLMQRIFPNHDSGRRSSD